MTQAMTISLQTIIAMRIWKIFAGFILIWILPELGAESTSETRVDPDKLERFEFQSRHMAVDFKIILYATEKPFASRASKAAFARIEALNSVLSDYQSDSEVRRLSASSGTGEKMKMGPDLAKVMRFSGEMFRETGGAFDPTVGPYVLAWRQARFFKGLPDPEKRVRMSAVVGFDKVQIFDDDSVELLVRGMRLDLGASGKGYAVDEALRVLQGHGIRSALVDGGGDMALGEPPPGKNGWSIEVEGGDEVLTLANCGVATSGDAYQFVEIDGVRYSHIVDPRTGMGVTHQSQLSVIAPNGLAADAWASAMCVLGESSRSHALAQKHGLQLIWVKRK